MTFTWDNWTAYSSSCRWYVVPLLKKLSHYMAKRTLQKVGKTMGSETFHWKEWVFLVSIRKLVESSGQEIYKTKLNNKKNKGGFYTSWNRGKSSSSSAYSCQKQTAFSFFQPWGVHQKSAKLHFIWAPRTFVLHSQTFPNAASFTTKEFKSAKVWLKKITWWQYKLFFLWASKGRWKNSICWWFHVVSNVWVVFFHFRFAFSGTKSWITANTSQTLVLQDQRQPQRLVLELLFVFFTLDVLLWMLINTGRE